MLKLVCAAALASPALATPPVAAPLDPAIVTVGSIHGGTKRNIIPDEVKLELTTRAFSEHGRQVILDGIRRMAQGIAVSAGLPPDRAPIVTVIDGESSPPLYNDPTLSGRVRVALVGALGAANAAAGRQLPGPHNSRFEPDPEPTLATGVRSMTAVALALLQ